MRSTNVPDDMTAATSSSSCSLRTLLLYLTAKRNNNKQPRKSLNYVWTQSEYLFCSCEVVRLAGLLSVSIPISRWHENLEGEMETLARVAAGHCGLVVSYVWIRSSITQRSALIANSLDAFIVPERSPRVDEFT